MIKTIKWVDKDVYVHYISINREYVLVSLFPIQEQMFSVPMGELELNGQTIESYLVVQISEEKSE